MKKVLICLVILPLILFFSIYFVKLIPELIRDMKNFLFFSYGIAAFIVLKVIFFRKEKGSFFENFTHELTHYIFALIFLKKVTSFKAYSKYGGEINLYGGNFFIALAPYFFPTFTIVFLILKPIVVNDLKPYFDFFIGLTYTFHIFLIIKDFRFSQPDVSGTGRVFSLVFVIFANLFFLSSIIILAGKNLEFLLNFYKEIFFAVINFGQALINRLI